MPTTLSTATNDNPWFSSPQTPPASSATACSASTATTSKSFLSLSTISNISSAPHGHGHITFDNVRVPASNIVLGKPPRDNISWGFLPDPRGLGPGGPKKSPTLSHILTPSQAIAAAMKSCKVVSVQAESTTQCARSAVQKSLSNG